MKDPHSMRISFSSPLRTYAQLSDHYVEYASLYTSHIPLREIRIYRGNFQTRREMR